MGIINSSSTEPMSDSFGADIPDVELFVRKVKEEQMFDDFIERKISENTICIWGFGGVGKSALLTLFANSTSKNNYQVIYGSMRSHNLTSFILFYARHLGLNPEENVNDHMVCNSFLKAIQKQTIIFIDDYPETKESDDLTNWLIDETNKRRNTKLLFVLACRRRPTFSPTSPISYRELKGMDESETEKFITSSVNQDSNWIKETAKHWEEIYLRTKGNPKIIELLCKNQHAWVFFKENSTIQLHTIEEINVLFTQIWVNIEKTTRKSAKLLATCIQISPYIPGELIKDLIPNSEMNNLLGLSILKKIGLDKFLLHDLFKDYIYEYILGKIERQKCHHKLGSYYNSNHQIENRNIYTLIHFVEAGSLQVVIQVYYKCIETMDNISNINLIKDLEAKILLLISSSGGGIQNKNDFECNVLRSIAEHNRVLSEYEAAISNFEKALQLTKPLEFYKLAICNIGMGDVYRRMGKYEDAIDHYWRAFNMCKSDDVLAAKAYTGLGAASNMLCNYSEAYEFHSKAEKLYQTNNDKKGIGRNLRGQAASLNLKGNCNDALQKYSDAKEIYESEFIDERGMAYAFWGIGESYRMIKNYQDSLTNFEVAIEKVKSIGDVWAETYINLNLGELYRSNHELTKAEKKFITAMELATRKYAHVEYAYAKLGIAETKRLQGIFDNKIYEEIIKAFKENNSC